MDPVWKIWWVWVVFGFALAVLEVLAPSYIFLGFALGAVATGVLILIGVTQGASFAAMVLVFALLSLLAWGGLRRWGKREGQVKIWDRDINDER